ncbi:hypothetical protein [Acinetobacter sp. YH12098]|uniref:hypothetical protein n=1 Tax=Acinetobacter sp. YH12098 TaxID=2601087 RepID=UPI0015D1CE4D|nr:hypothetical protein [Acinetobacter sp. YH12098]
MNLIEQLGGYEKAKIRLGSCDITLAYYQELDRQLLEYRRQHNIFEEGDNVVSRCNDKETRIFKYETTIGKNIVVKCKKGKGYCYPKKWFSHANDAEIKAGKRLEVS